MGTTNATLGTVFRVDDVSVLATFPAQQYSASATLSVTAPPPPGIAFTASPDVVAPGQSSTLDWISGGTTSCSASNGWSGTKPTGGNQLVTPSVTTTYTLSCSGPGGTATSSVTVVVQVPAPTVALSANPTSIQVGASSTLIWSSTNATSCTPLGPWSNEGAKLTNGSELVSPPQSATYLLSCTGPGGTATGTADIQVTPHTIVFSVGPNGTPNPVNSGGPVQLSAVAVDSLGHSLTYSWSATCVGSTGNGSFDNASSSTPTWTAPSSSAGTTASCKLSITASDGSGLSQTASFSEVVGAVTAPPLKFFTLAPCRIIDTRKPSGLFGGPSLTAGVNRSFNLHGQCGIPSTAKAVAVNITVVNPSNGGYLLLFPGDITPPGVSTINFGAGQVRANNAVLSLSSQPPGIVATLVNSGTVDMILDVNGYFE